MLCLREVCCVPTNVRSFLTDLLWDKDRWGCCVGQNFAVPEDMLTVSVHVLYLTDVISRQMCAVSGPAKTEKSAIKENISGQMVHCANDVC